MKISEKTQDVMLELNEFSGSKIKNINEVSSLIEITDALKQDKLFYDIQFAAKYLNGLGKILQSTVAISTDKNSNGNGTTPENIEAKEKIKDEFKKNMKKITDDLKKLLEHADESFRTGFEEKYLSLSRTSLHNLTTLIYDLSWLKKYNNSKRD